ncbi:uncharacterized protein DS421_19g662480 [Arachis hypogaea]|uniref:Uncharacterized protein n=1 Tax=Arachis hypogaea TaxID=3818 RepID=A0A6B9VCZ7_ARAHY|nr:uncharacterized protein DS421_19g662480 [Arachis hypogaea]
MARSKNGRGEEMAGEEQRRLATERGGAAKMASGVRHPPSWICWRRRRARKRSSNEIWRQDLAARTERQRAVAAARIPLPFPTFPSPLLP